MRPVLVLLLAIAVLANVSGAPLMATNHQVVCFLDVDGDQVVALDEPLYLIQGSCGNGAQGGDVRLSHETIPRGTIMRGSDPDADRSLQPVAGRYVYVDLDGSGSYGRGDEVYLQLRGNFPSIQVGDLRITSEPFTRVASGDSDENHPIVLLQSVGQETYSEVDGFSGYTPGDVVYLDLDVDGQTTINDVRLAVPQQALEPSTSNSVPSSTQSSAQDSVTSSSSSPSSSEQDASTTDSGSRPASGLGFLSILVAVCYVAARRIR